LEDGFRKDITPQRNQKRLHTQGKKPQSRYGFAAEAGVSKTYHIPMPSACPICKRPVDAPPVHPDASGSPHFPFCSERCKLIDLGRWLDGKYQVPVVDDDLDEGGVEERDRGPNG
jgi:hypothetical protein